MRVLLCILSFVALGCSFFVPRPKDLDAGTDDSVEGDMPADHLMDWLVDGPDGLDGPDLPTECTPDTHACFNNADYFCNSDGNGWVLESECPDGQYCAEGGGCIQCSPDQHICIDNVSMACDPGNDRWLLVRDCTQWESSCVDGYCEDECGDAERERSHLGCEFWPTILPNPLFYDAELENMGISITNPSADQQVDVRIVHLGGSEDSLTVPAGQSYKTSVPLMEWVTGGLPQGDWNSMLPSESTVRLVSTRPVSVTQMIPDMFNEGANAMTTEGSLLLPLHSMTNSYVVASVPPSSMQDSVGVGVEKTASYFTIVAVAPGTTTMNIELGMHLAGDTAGRFEDTSIGNFITFDMEQFEVAHMASAVPPDCMSGVDGHVDLDGIDFCYPSEYDPSNTQIWATQTIAVFGGAVQARVPYFTEEPDHLQEQIPPRATLGQHFVTAPMVEPGTTPAVSRIRLVVIYDGTDILIEPEQDGFSTDTLGGGGTLDLELTDPVEIQTSRPILLIQNLVGQNFTDPSMSIGDPAMTLIVPTVQYRTSYEFYSPPDCEPSSDGQTYVMVTRPQGVDVQMDGALLGESSDWSFAGLPSYEWDVGIFPVDTNRHVITCESPVGVHVFGLGPHAGFAHPAGTNLQWINTMD